MWGLEDHVHLGAVPVAEMGQRVLSGGPSLLPAELTHNEVLQQWAKVVRSLRRREVFRSQPRQGRSQPRVREESLRPLDLALGEVSRPAREPLHKEERLQDFQVPLNSGPSNAQLLRQPLEDQFPHWSRRDQDQQLTKRSHLGRCHVCRIPLDKATGVVAEPCGAQAWVEPLSGGIATLHNAVHDVGTLAGNGARLDPRKDRRDPVAGAPSKLGLCKRMKADRHGSSSQGVLCVRDPQEVRRPGQDEAPRPTVLIDLCLEREDQLWATLNLINHEAPITCGPQESHGIVAGERPGHIVVHRRQDVVFVRQHSHEGRLPNLPRTLNNQDRRRIQDLAGPCAHRPRQDLHAWRTSISPVLYSRFAELCLTIRPL